MKNEENKCLTEYKKLYCNNCEADCTTSILDCNGYQFFSKGYEDCRHYAHNYYKPKWHDLRKDANDLPKQITLVIMYIIGNAYCNGWFNGDCWIIDNGNMKKIDCENVIAWCELPMFEE